MTTQKCVKWMERWMKDKSIHSNGERREKNTLWNKSIREMQLQNFNRISKTASCPHQWTNTIAWKQLKRMKILFNLNFFFAVSFVTELIHSNFSIYMYGSVSFWWRVTEDWKFHICETITNGSLWTLEIYSLKKKLRF